VLFLLFGPFLADLEARKKVVRGQPGSEITAMCYCEYFPSPGSLAGGDEPYSGEKHEKLNALVSEPAACAAEFLGTLLLALVVFALGAGPFVQTVEELAWAAGVAIVVPVALYLLAIPFGRGAIGEGDLKLLVGAGLLIGGQTLFYGLVVGALAAGLIVGVLVFIRRLSMKSFVPYGPFLIAGILWSILAVSQP